jgi:hypothetical protein
MGKRTFTDSTELAAQGQDDVGVSSVERAYSVSEQVFTAGVKG